MGSNNRNPNKRGVNYFLNVETIEKVNALAAATYRTPGQVVAWLVDLAFAEHEKNLTPSISPSVKGGQEVEEVAA